MKRLILFALIFSAGNVFADSAYIPAEINLPFKPLEGSASVYILPQFFPVGWSKDGKFAYFTYCTFENNGVPNTVFQFVIQNLIDDKSVWETSFAKTKEVSLPQVWQKYESEINTKLAQYKIAQYEGELGGFPINTKKGAVDYEIRVTQKKTSLGVTYIDTIEFHALLGKTGDKTILKEKNAQTLRLSVPGFMKSPFEDRIAVIMLKVKRTDQEGIYPVELQIIGCHLTIGFKETDLNSDETDNNEDADFDPDKDEFEIEIDDDGNF